MRLGALAACVALAIVPLAARASADPFAGLKYRAIGPAISGGRTTAVVGSDADPFVYYAGGADGGVFKSSDGGTVWRPVTDSLPSAAVGALAVAARDPNDVWLGTGESNPRNDMAEGLGMWRSRDGGKTWRRLGLDDAGSIASIALDPRDAQVAVVAVLGRAFRDGQMRGVYLTRDGGAHWTRTLYAGPDCGASDVVRLPGRPATLFAGMWEFRRTPWSLSSGGARGGVFRSDDGGAHWRPVRGAGLPRGITGRIGLTAAGTRLYAIVQSREGELWRSDDGGERWRRLPHSPLVGARPFYFSKVFADPAKPDRVLSVGVFLALSEDGGRSFSVTAKDVGWDYHALWWSSDGKRAIDGNDEGVMLSVDAGAHWRQPYDLPFSQPYHLGLDGSLPAYRICTGLQDDNTWCAPSSSYNGIGVLNRDWFIAGPGDGMHALFDPRDPSLIWSTSVNTDPGNVYIYDARTQQTREVSPGAEDLQGAAAAAAVRFNWDTPIAFAGDGRALVGGNVLFASSDRGEHWSAISPDLTRNDKTHQRPSGGPIDEDASGAEYADTISSIAPSMLPAGPLWVGTDDGLVWVSRDDGLTWKNVTPPGLAPWGRVATVEPDRAAAGTAFVAIDRHMSGDDRPYIYVTADFGASWRALAAGLPLDASVDCVRQDPRDPALLVAGTRRGVWVSLDGGGAWRSLRLNMPATAIFDLAFAPAAGDLVVASHGRGIWILDDLRVLEQWPSAARGLAFVAPRPAYATWRAAPVNTFVDGAIPAGEFVGENAAYGALFTYTLSRPARRIVLEIRDGAGHVVRRLGADKLPHAGGLARAAWDLAEDGPIRWSGTYEQNRGPKTGAEAVPGTYTVRLSADGMRLERPLVVLPDPRSSASPADYAERHRFLSELFGEVGGVDAMLNALDARSKAGGGRATSVALRRRLTYDPRNVEDLRGPPGLRERLLDLIARVAPTSFQTSTAVQSAQAQALRAEYAAARAAFAGGGWK